MAKDSSGGGDNHLVSGGEDVDKDSVDEGCYTKGEEDGAVSRGMELVTYSRVDESESSGWVCQNEEEMLRHLGWVQEMVDDGLMSSLGLLSLLVVREPEVLWNDGEKLTVGMSQEEVSNWVLKRVGGFGKFLGVSFDGFEDIALKLFTDIEGKWRKGAVSETKKGGNRDSEGERELKRLQCSINYEGRKRVGERCSEGVGGVNLLLFYED